MKIIFIILFWFASCLAQNYKYECKKDNNHIIHIVTLNPERYRATLIKSHDQVFGKETVENMAKRTNAQIAINGGFFESGKDEDGINSGTMVLDGKILGLKFAMQTCLIQDENGLSIEQFNPRIQAPVRINKVNRPCLSNDSVLYSHFWGKTTLTPILGRKEIIFEGNNLKIIMNGNNTIPIDGFVLSIPTEQNLPDLSQIKFLPDSIFSRKKLSMIMGIPMLIENSQKKLLDGTSHFYLSPHARTAIGIKPNKEIVLVIAEHSKSKDFKNITLGEVNEIISKNKLENPTIKELSVLINKEITSSKATGLTLSELADLMLELGCEKAMNLDGGSSSTLFIEGKIVNECTCLPVSDAILFIDNP